jgi:hypothetical protein
MGALNTNFDLSADLDARDLKVTGTTDGADPGWELVSRNFVVQQNTTKVQRQATKTGNWRATGRIPRGDFTGGPALAVGTETYYVAGTPVKPSSFITVTWSQNITIEDRS